MRRVGKSTFAHLLAGEKKYVFMNFDDERLIGFTSNRFQLLLDAFHDLDGEPDCFLFDEVQNISGWELFINRIRPGHRIIITGSNANLMSAEMATHLTGRYDEWTLHPMSFDEFLRFKNTPLPANHGHSTSQRSRFKKLFDEYCFSGGIFEGYTLGKEHLRTLFRSVFTKDIIGRYRISYPAALEELAAIIINSFAQSVSLNKIAKRIGLKSPHTIKDYLGYLETTYLFFSVKKFSFRIKEQQASLRKAYCCDNGMISSMLFETSANAGRFLENLVAVELKRRERTGGSFFYWDDYRRECDFVIKCGNKVTEAIQVCHELTEENRNREQRGILAAMEEFNLDCGTILTADQEDELELEGKRLRVIPAWMWLLENT
jgi:predicted AAA+ superfamily ATPase